MTQATGIIVVGNLLLPSVEEMLFGRVPVQIPPFVNPLHQRIQEGSLKNMRMICLGYSKMLSLRTPEESKTGGLGCCQ